MRNIQIQAERAWEKHLNQYRAEFPKMKGAAFLAVKLSFKFNWVCAKFNEQTKKQKR